MWGQRSPAELYTERQNNGQLTYNRAPHLRPDRFADPLLHRHGLQNAATAETPGLFATDSRGMALASRNAFTGLLMMPVLLVAYVPYLVAAWLAGAGLFFEFGQPWWLSIGTGLGVLLGAPFIIPWLHHTAANMKERGWLLHIPVRLLVSAAPFYIGITWGPELLSRYAPELSATMAGIVSGVTYSCLVYFVVLPARPTRRSPSSATS